MPSRMYGVPNGNGMTFSLHMWRVKMGKALGKGAPITQREAGAILGYSPSYIQRIELEKTKVPRLLPDACENKLRKAKNKS